MNFNLQAYRQLDRSVWYLIFAELIIFSINSAFYLIANIFMAKANYSDPEIASILSVRFASVLLFAIPFGLFIKKKPLKPFLFMAVSLIIVASYVFVESVESHALFWVYLSSVSLGLVDSSTRIISITYILRNLPNEQHTHGLSLNAASWSGSVVLGGGLIGLFGTMNPVFFTEANLLRFFALMGIFAFYFVFKMKSDEAITQHKNKEDIANSLLETRTNYNWKGITIASIPIVLIATGAGLTMPYVNLFFFHSFGIDSNLFAVFGMLASLLVVFALLLVPIIKARWGYRAITITQSLSVVALFCMATSDFYTHLSWVVFIAVGAFLLRQPLMNTAGPMTSEMAMYYVGADSREMMASLTATIWSGAWFFSARIFKYLSELNYSYGEIFYITILLYIVGISAYYMLILDFEKKLAKGEIEI